MRRSAVSLLDPVSKIEKLLRIARELRDHYLQDALAADSGAAGFIADAIAAAEADARDSAARYGGDQRPRRSAESVLADFSTSLPDQRLRREELAHKGEPPGTGK